MTRKIVRLIPILLNTIIVVVFIFQLPSILPIPTMDVFVGLMKLFMSAHSFELEGRIHELPALYYLESTNDIWDGFINIVAAKPGGDKLIAYLPKAIEHCGSNEGSLIKQLHGSIIQGSFASRFSGENSIYEIDGINIYLYHEGVGSGNNLLAFQYYASIPQLCHYYAIILNEANDKKVLSLIQCISFPKEAGKAKLLNSE